LTQEEQRAGETLKPVYNIFERELLKAGFTVRDRGLLMEVLRDNPKADYKAIKEKIDTQLILEIVSYQQVDVSNAAYTEVPNGTKGTAAQPFLMKRWVINAKVIMVESGEIGSIYTLYWVPTNAHFVSFPHGNSWAWINASESGVGTPGYFGYVVPAEAAAAPFVIAILRGLRQ
jgi:hypothetical protein